MSRPTGTNRVTRRYLAAIDKTTGIPTAWDPNDSGRLLLHTVSPVSAIATDGAHLYFASATTGEVQRADLGTANVDQNWRFVVSRTGGQPGSVTAMVVNGGAVYLGGEFDSVAGVGITATPRRAVAAVGADGALRPWAPALDGPAGITLLRSLLSFGSTIYMGGGFSAVNGQFRLGFAAVDAVSHVLVQPEMFVLGDTRIRGLDTDGARVFVVGESFGAPFIGASSIPDRSSSSSKCRTARCRPARRSLPGSCTRASSTTRSLGKPRPAQRDGTPWWPDPLRSCISSAPTAPWSTTPRCQARRPALLCWRPPWSATS